MQWKLELEINFRSFCCISANITAVCFLLNGDQIAFDFRCNDTAFIRHKILIQNLETPSETHSNGANFSVCNSFQVMIANRYTSILSIQAKEIRLLECFSKSIRVNLKLNDKKTVWR